MSKSHYILGIDTSHEQGQLCLYKDQELLENIQWEKKGSHSEILNFNFDEVHKKYGFSFLEISKIYCSVGPGSFTGLRVGINFCKTLSYAHGIELIPVNTLLLLAYNCDEISDPIISTIDAQKNSLFVSIFDKNKSATLENQIIDIKNLESLIQENHFSCGLGISRYNNFIHKDVISMITHNKLWSQPDLRKIIPVNESKSFLKPCAWSELKPLYIRLSSAEEKLNSN